MSDDIQSYIANSPLLAAAYGKEGDERLEVFKTYSNLSEGMQDFLAAPATADALEKLTAQGAVPPNFSVAIAKIVFLTCTGEVEQAQIPGLLIKLGLTPAQAAQVGNTLQQLLDPVIGTAAVAPTPSVGMPELPVLTRPSQSGPKPLTTGPRPSTAGQSASGRNIIDLRLPTGQAGK